MDELFTLTPDSPWYDSRYYGFNCGKQFHNWYVGRHEWVEGWDLHYPDYIIPYDTSIEVKKSIYESLETLCLENRVLFVNQYGVDNAVEIIMRVEEGSLLLGRTVILEFDVECISRSPSDVPNQVEISVFNDIHDCHDIGRTRCLIPLILEIDDQHQRGDWAYYIQIRVRPVHREMYFYSMKGYMV